MIDCTSVAENLSHCGFDPLTLEVKPVYLLTRDKKRKGAELFFYCCSVQVFNQRQFFCFCFPMYTKRCDVSVNHHFWLRGCSMQGKCFVCLSGKLFSGLVDSPQHAVCLLYSQCAVLDGATNKTESFIVWSGHSINSNAVNDQETAVPIVSGTLLFTAGRQRICATVGVHFKIKGLKRMHVTPHPPTPAIKAKICTQCYEWLSKHINFQLGSSTADRVGAVCVFCRISYCWIHLESVKGTFAH